jgi:hypothetical protein
VTHSHDQGETFCRAILALLAALCQRYGIAEAGTLEAASKVNCSFRS